ncbi:hypothetical protein MKZ38_001255 [Zalerion maritima]|uniref:Uncharacterized protein n=1 Tax=Zalerion maritima TaxID=339359 RepID=A0AAD5RG03_9PEZI|nr:hypothetical protein MKZ38_001255 [Zalerion maritima]
MPEADGPHNGHMRGVHRKVEQVELLPTPPRRRECPGLRLGIAAWSSSHIPNTTIITFTNAIMGEPMSIDIECCTQDEEPDPFEEYMRLVYDIEDPQILRILAECAQSENEFPPILRALRHVGLEDRHDMDVLEEWEKDEILKLEHGSAPYPNNASVYDEQAVEQLYQSEYEYTIDSTGATDEEHYSYGCSELDFDHEGLMECLENAADGGGPEDMEYYLSCSSHLNLGNIGPTLLGIAVAARNEDIIRYLRRNCVEEFYDGGQLVELLSPSSSEEGRGQEDEGEHEEI